MIAKNELLKWLLESPGEFVGVDEGGLTLACADSYGRDEGAYLEIGGLSEFFDQDNEHPDYPLEDWQSEAAAGHTYLGYTEWVESRLSSET